MASINFVDQTTVVPASWLNDVNALVYTVFGGTVSVPAAGKIFRSNGTAMVASTSTFADTYGINTILYAGTANTITGLATANSGVLNTSAAGVPSITATPTLGASGTLGSITMGNATTGLLTLQPVTGALGTVTVSLPAATDTLVGKATTDVLTNKTYDTAGAGNVLKVNGTQLTAVTGTGAVVLAAGPTFTGSIGIGGTAPAGGGSGISFPASQSASTDPNTLDDYEEGTWTPTDGSGAGLSFTSVTANYVKIGREIIAHYSLTYPVTANGSNAQVNGLPYTVNGAASARTGFTTINTTSPNIVIAPIPNAGTTNYLWVIQQSSAAATNAQMSTAVEYGAVVYFV